MYKVLIAVIAVIVVIGGGFLFFSRNNSASLPPPVSQEIQNPPPTVSNKQQGTLPSEPQPSQNTITYTSNGFSPANLTIKAGTMVIWINNSDSLSVQSNPHPVHTDYPPLNIGAIANGQSKSLVFDKPGTYGYHNHLNPSNQGKIIVE